MDVRVLQISTFVKKAPKRKLDETKLLRLDKILKRAKKGKVKSLRGHAAEIDDDKVHRVIDMVVRVLEMACEEFAITYVSLDERIKSRRDHGDEKDDGSVNVMTTVHGNGTGYSGASGDDNQQLRDAVKQKIEQRDAMDQCFGTLFRFLAEFLRTRVFENKNEKSRIHALSRLNFSVVNTLLAVAFREASVMEIRSRNVYYKNVFTFCAVLTSRPDLVCTLQVPRLLPGTSVLQDNVPLQKLVKDLHKQLDLYVKNLDKEDLKEESTVVQIAEQVQETRDNIRVSLVAANEALSEEEEFKMDPNDLKEEKEIDDNDKIREWMFDQKFRIQDLSEATFTFQANLDSDSVMPKRKLKRLRKEVAMLSNSLPDGIFLCVDENRYDKMKVMIVGPVQTPYEMGCFLFDLYLPAGYPDVCPRMKYLTTGAASFYFNPNLYANGKVCLSLLGTWNGPGWDPETSTLLQLLVSIQALVFVDHPYENEPGREGQALSEISKSYNKGIHRATALYAMLWHFEDSHKIPEYFRDIVQAHFYLNGHYIEELLEAWDSNDESVSNSCSYHRWEGNMFLGWRETRDGLHNLFEELQPPVMIDEDDDEDDI